MSAPLVRGASTTTTAWERPEIMRLRRAKMGGATGPPNGWSATKKTRRHISRAGRPRPPPSPPSNGHPSTATVWPWAARAVRCACSSIPMANPDTIRMPRLDQSEQSKWHVSRPRSEGRRVPTTATERGWVNSKVPCTNKTGGGLGIRRRGSGYSGWFKAMMLAPISCACWAWSSAQFLSGPFNKLRMASFPSVGTSSSSEREAQKAAEGDPNLSTRDRARTDPTCSICVRVSQSRTLLGVVDSMAEKDARDCMPRKYCSNVQKSTLLAQEGLSTDMTAFYTVAGLGAGRMSPMPISSRLVYPRTHRFHIPVMGTGHSIDTPLRVARWGISSVISLVDDILVEQVHRLHAERLGLVFQGVDPKDPKARAERIRRYMDFLYEQVQLQMKELRAQSFADGSDKMRWFAMLPDSSPMKIEWIRIDRK